MGIRAEGCGAFRPLVRIGGGLVLAAAGMIAFATSASAAEPHQLVKLANRERAARGIAPLVEDAGLDAAVAPHCKAMAAAGRIFHDPALGATVKGWSIVGENVAVGIDLQRIHDAFMASTIHRSNILETRFRFIGVCAVRGGGAYWATEIFFDRIGVASTPARASSAQHHRSTSAAAVATPPAAAARAAVTPVRRAPPNQAPPAVPASGTLFQAPARSVRVLERLTSLEGSRSSRRTHRRDVSPSLSSHVGARELGIVAEAQAVLRPSSPTNRLPVAPTAGRERRTRGPPIEINLRE